MYKFRFTKSASEDLKAIKKYIYNDNRIAAKEVVAYIINQLETVLANNPTIGRAGRVLGTREFVITKYPYILPYQVKNEILYILRVLHTSRKWE